MAKTIKALRDSVQIGALAVEGLMLPNGMYKMSDTDICSAIDEPPSSISKWRASSAFKSLLLAGLAISEKPEKLKIAGYNKHVNASDLETASQYWLSRAAVNPKAFQLCAALMQETLERRFDRTFEQKVDEEERDRRLKERMQGKLVRRTFTDAIQSYMEHHEELSANAVKFMYSNASDQVNRAVFARPAKKLCQDLNVADKDLLRDHFTVVELRHVQEVEDLAMRLIDGEDMEPNTAVKEARSRLVIPISDRVAS